jgi:hypothetical protein
MQMGTLSRVSTLVTENQLLAGWRLETMFFLHFSNFAMHLFISWWPLFLSLPSLFGPMAGAADSRKG